MGRSNIAHVAEGALSRRGFIAAAGVATAAAAAGAGAAQADEAQASWDAEYDFVVAGSGTGIWGALAAKASGLDKVVIVERRGILGGTAALCTAASGCR